MTLCAIMEDEWFPVLTPLKVSEPTNAPLIVRAQQVDIPDELIERWERVYDEINALQDELRKIRDTVRA